MGNADKNIYLVFCKEKGTVKLKISLEGFVQDAIHRKLDLYHVLVRQHGEIVGSFDWRENRRDNIHSVSKSFLSIAIGMAVEEGILRLDEYPAEIFRE